jgi:hypothetical protein
MQVERNKVSEEIINNRRRFLCTSAMTITCVAPWQKSGHGKKFLASLFQRRGKNVK